MDPDPKYCLLGKDKIFKYFELCELAKTIQNLIIINQCFPSIWDEPLKI